MSNDDYLVALVVNAAKFDPPLLPNITGFNFILGSNNFNVGSFPYLQVDPREGVDATEKVFNFHN